MNEHDVNNGGDEAGGTPVVVDAADAPAFPPPAASERAAGIPPMTTTRNGSTPKRSRARAVTVAVVAIGLVLAVGGWLVLSARNGSTAAPVEGLARLPENPQQRYTTNVDAAAVVNANGSPDRVWVMLNNGDGYQIAMFDGAGAELWRRPIDDEVLIKQVGDDLVLQPYTPEDTQLTVVDGDTGEDRWSTTVSGMDVSAIVDGNIMMVSRSDPDATTLTVYDPATGDKIAERQVDSLQSNFVTPPADGKLLLQEGDEIFVVDGRLENISAPIPASAARTPTSLAAMGDEILVAGNGTITRYRLDGTEIATADSDVGAIDFVVGVENSTWMYFADGGCGAIDFPGDQVEQLWEIADCTITLLPPEMILRSGDSDPFVVVSIDEAAGPDQPDSTAPVSTAPDSTDPDFAGSDSGPSNQGPSIVNAATGELAFSSDGHQLLPAANGFLDWGPDSVAARTLPSGDELYLVQLDGQQFNPLDNGYAIVDESGGDIVMTVYG